MLIEGSSTHLCVSAYADNMLVNVIWVQEEELTDTVPICISGVITISVLLILILHAAVLWYPRKNKNAR